MKTPPDELLHRYFDDMLDDSQIEQLNDWIKSDRVHARRFAELTLLHDRMRNTIQLLDGTRETDSPVDARSHSEIFEHSSSRSRSGRDLFSPFWWAAACAALVLCGLVWNGLGESTAAGRELNRIIEKNNRLSDRVYELVVEHTAPIKQRDTSSAANQTTRPPKPSLDGARLYVRDSNQFVLVRHLEKDTSFVTGSDGKTSWAVRDAGPVRVSSDLNRFNRDLPGHESSIPLTNIYQGLEHLKKAYQVQLAPLGPEEFNQDNKDRNAATQYRMLIAVKKPKERGPQRVEIVYETESGNIQHFRFIQMPFGPDRLDLRLSLVDESPLDDDFFGHASHHAPDRVVEFEE